MEGMIRRRDRSVAPSGVSAMTKAKATATARMTGAGTGGAGQGGAGEEQRVRVSTRWNDQGLPLPLMGTCGRGRDRNTITRPSTQAINQTTPPCRKDGAGRRRQW